MKLVIDISEHEWEYLNKLVANGDQLGHYERLLVNGELMQEPKGHWKFTDKCHEHGICSNCNYGEVDLVNGKPHNYCPNCGAKMEYI